MSCKVGDDNGVYPCGARLLLAAAELPAVPLPVAAAAFVVKADEDDCDPDPYNWAGDKKDEYDRPAGGNWERKEYQGAQFNLKAVSPLTRNSLKPNVRLDRV